MSHAGGLYRWLRCFSLAVGEFRLSRKARDWMSLPATVRALTIDYEVFPKEVQVTYTYSLMARAYSGTLRRVTILGWAG